MPLWHDPLPAGDAALEAFRGVYRDPLVVNGVSTPLSELVDRARMMQSAFDSLQHELLEFTAGDGREAFAFRLSGRLVGPLTTPLGVIEPTGQELAVLGMDVFVLDGDRVGAVWALADYLSLLLATGAVTPL